MLFLNFWLGINIFIFIITIIITLCFVWIDILAFSVPLNNVRSRKDWAELPGYLTSYLVA